MKKLFLVAIVLMSSGCVQQVDDNTELTQTPLPENTYLVA